MSGIISRQYCNVFFFFLPILLDQEERDDIVQKSEFLRLLGKQTNNSLKEAEKEIEIKASHARKKEENLNNKSTVRILSF